MLQKKNTIIKKLKFINQMRRHFFRYYNFAIFLKLDKYNRYHVNSNLQILIGKLSSLKKT